MSNKESVEGYIVDILKNTNIEDEEIRRVLEEKRDAEQFLKLIAPKYMGVYIVDRKTDLFKDIVGPSYFRKMTKEKNGKYLDALTTYCDEMVVSSDKPKFDFLFDYDSLYKYINQNKTYEITYKKIDGVNVKLQVSSYSNNDSEKDISIWVYINENLDERRRRLERQRKVIYGLTKDYSSVWLIDSKTLIGELIKTKQDSEAMEDGFIYNGASYNYCQKIVDYANKYVCDEFKKEFIEKTNINNILKQLEKDNSYKIIFKRLSGGKEEFYQLEYTTADDFSNSFIMAYKNVNEEFLAEKERNEALKTALLSAQHANQAKTRFLNNISHDIRTPMNAIVGFTALARRDIEDQEKVKDYLKKITTSSDHLLSLINDVLDMSRIESGKIKIEEKEVHLPDVFHDLRTIMQPDIASKDINLYFDTQGVINEDVICDRLRLNQVMINLLNNAIKFTPNGGIVSVSLIQKPTKHKGFGLYEIHVKDNGIGMSLEFQKHVFDAFAREETSTVSKIQGSGLGMAIAKNIINLMNGSISVNSKPNDGTEFVVELEFKLSNNPIVYGKIEQLQNIRALVVDDDLNSCHSICEMLTDIGLKPDFATSFKETLIKTENAISENDAYGVYIINSSMPNIAGLEIVRQITNKQTPIIIMMAYDYSDIEEEAYSLGVSAFCTKPIFMSELRNALAKPFKTSKEIKAKDDDFSCLIGKKILLVEDNKLNQEVAIELLSNTGLIVDVCDDGDIAVAKMRYAKVREYDCILMDIQMPKMDGFTATREIRTLTNSSVANTPIIALTADAFTETKKAAIQAGMNGHVSKPLNIKEVLKAIKNIIQ